MSIEQLNVKLTKEALKDILDKHMKWWRNEEGGKRAYLQGADLQGADLQGAYLRGADLQGADLQGADLRGAYLQRADLRGADLQGADLRRADLRGADLQGADLQGADLQGADLQGAYLRGADLQGADLQRADLQGAYLQRADLRGAYLQRADLQDAYLQRADLQGAYLQRADLRGAYLRDDTKIRLAIQCPDTGAFIAWKAAGGYIVKLEIPEDAKRCSATTRKCRADKAKVLEIQNIDGSIADVTEVKSERGGIYKLGEMIYPDSFDECRWNECSHGIHFFVTRMEAEDWI